MIANVQLLRALAALLVVVAHISFTWMTSHAQSFPAWMPVQIGSSGVDIFFVISSFIMLHTTLFAGNGVTAKEP